MGAGFYLNATQPTWKNWRMYDYITKELPSVLQKFKELDLSNVRNAFSSPNTLPMCPIQSAMFFQYGQLACSTTPPAHICKISVSHP